MSANIRVESGISAGTSYWIDRPVLRIGSDPQCEICLPSAELASHALTLEYRNGTYRAYNRATAAIRIGSKMVQPGTAGDWNEAETALLPGDLRLVLQIDGDPRPCPRPDTAAVDDDFAVEGQPTSGEAASTTKAEPATKKSSKTTIQMAIIAVCVLATAGFLLMPQAPETNAASRPSFDAIVKNSLAKGDEIRALARDLQFAQATLIRGQNERAGELFLKLRDRLVRQKDTLPEADRVDAQNMLDYVQFRLGQLQQ